jgi:hypothetical protein
MTNAIIFLLESLMGRNHHEDTDEGERIILNQISRKLAEGVD